MKLKRMTVVESQEARKAPWGTQIIRCGDRKCGWAGKETDLVIGMAQGIGTKLVCPSCSKDYYYFVKEVK